MEAHLKLVKLKQGVAEKYDIAKLYDFLNAILLQWFFEENLFEKKNTNGILYWFMKSKERNLQVIFLLVPYFTL